MTMNHDWIMPQTNEDFVSFGDDCGGNLTPLQQAYSHVWRRMRPMQRDGQSWDCMVLGFRSGQARQGSTDSALDPASPIRPAHEVRLLGVAPMPLQEVMSPRAGAPRRRDAHYRLHFFDLACAVQGGDVNFSARIERSFQADAAKLPRQDHQRYRQRRYDPSSVGEIVAEAAHMASAAVLTAPRGGVLSTLRDDLHFRVLIEGVDAFRFLLRDMDAVELPQTSGQVAKGDELGRLVRAVDFQEAEFDAHGQPQMCYIGGDMLAASRRNEHLHFATQAMAQMTDYALAQRDSSLDCAYIESLEDVMPRHLVQFPLSVIEERYERGWRPNQAFAKLLCYYLGPDAKRADSDGYLAIRSPLDGVLDRVLRREDGLELVFVDSDGREHSRVVPAAAVLSSKAASVMEGGEPQDVIAGEDLGDYVPRRWYADVAAIVSLAGDSGLVKLERILFDELLLRPGQLGWRGEGACVDRRFVGESLLPAATGHWIDLSPLAAFYDAEYKLYRLPPVHYAREHGLSRRVNQICYDFTPVGPKFAGAAPRLAAQPGRSRARRNRRRRHRTSS